MHPEKLGFEDCDLIHIFEAVNKETQTSNTSITDKPENSLRLPFSRDKNNTDKGTVSIFEFCQVLQDSETPSSITIVRDRPTGESINHSKEPSLENAISSKHRYCKEVIKPYLKSYLRDCPDSEEQLIIDIIQPIDQEYPDYQPCFDVYEASTYREDKSINSAESSGGKLDAVTSYNSNMDSKECPLKEEIASSVIKDQKNHAKVEACSSDIENSVESKEKSAKSKFDPKASTTNVTTKCVNDSTEQQLCPLKEEKPIPKPGCPSPASDNECNKSECSKSQNLGETDFTINDRPTSHVQDSPQSESVNLDTLKTMVETHTETLTTIKTAMEGFITKVYKTTQDAVNVIKTESRKHLDTFRQSKSNNTENMQPQSSSSKTEKTIPGFSLLNKIESKDKKDDTTEEKQAINPSEILERIASKVDSTISIISDNINLENISDMLNPSKFKDRSSPYDVPTPPKEISHIINGPVQSSNSVFVAIRNRLYSIFSENNDKANDISGSNSSIPPSPPLKEDSDEDLINKLIE